MGGADKCGNRGEKRERSSPENSNSNEAKKRNMSTESKLDQILKTMMELKTQAQESAVKMEAMETGLKEEMRDLKSKLEEKEAKWGEERRSLIESHKQLEAQLEQMERTQRRNNAIVTGPALTPESAHIVVREALTALNKTIKPAEISCLRTKGAPKVLIRFQCFDDKIDVFKNRKSLKQNSPDGKSHPLYINDDHTKKDQEINFHMRKLAREMRTQKKEVKFGPRRLLIDGEWFVWDDEEKKLVRQKN